MDGVALEIEFSVCKLLRLVGVWDGLPLGDSFNSFVFTLSPNDAANMVDSDDADESTRV